MRIWLTLGMLCALTAPPAIAQTQPDPEKLEEVKKAEETARSKEAELTKKRTKISSEITSLKNSLRKSARKARVFEREAAGLQDELAFLTQDITQTEIKLSDDKQSLLQLIAALQRLDVNPPPTLTTNPDTAIEAAQSAQLMGQISTQLKERANQIAFTLTELDVKKNTALEQQRVLKAKQTNLENSNTEMRALVDKKSTLEKSIAKEESLAREDVRRLAAEAKTLQELLENFEQQSASINPRVKPRGSNPKRPSKPLTLPKGTKKFAQAKGTLMRPVVGKLLRGYGNGEKGLTYTGQSNGQVLAPYTGRVEFAGPFKNYDQVVILNVGSGYFILLTGLAETFSQAGEVVKMGEPVGLLPFKTQGKPRVYFELRKGGGTINPAPWLRPRSVKSG